MKYIILLIFAIMCAGTCVAQSPDVLMVGNPPVAYTVVVEDNMINYPMGKAYPGKVHSVGDGFVFMDMIVPTGFYDNNRKPVGVHEDATPRFRYFDGNGQPDHLDVDGVGEIDGTFYLPITPNFNGGWEWHVNCPGCNQRYVQFGPGWNNDNWSN